MSAEVAYPVAYCAPGRKDITALRLAAEGCSVNQIIEHAWLDGLTDAFVVTEPPPLMAGPEAFRVMDPYRWEVLPDTGNAGCYFPLEDAGDR